MRRFKSDRPKVLADLTFPAFSHQWEKWRTGSQAIAPKVFANWDWENITSCAIAKTDFSASVIRDLEFCEMGLGVADCAATEIRCRSQLGLVYAMGAKWFADTFIPGFQRHPL
ncbi:MAG: hypothetical protein ICV54_14520 [Nostoc sp. C3-bin3]|nr:hypothetical protein [Nostoc sp. C3-bin3]